jgi:hypothetical protein
MREQPQLLRRMAGVRLVSELLNAIQLGHSRQAYAENGVDKLFRKVRLYIQHGVSLSLTLEGRPIP